MKPFDDRSNNASSLAGPVPAALLGDRHPHGRSGVPVGSGPLQPVPDLGGVTAIPADDDLVDGALRLVVALARATVGGADGVSVSLRRNGRLSTVAASDQTILDMDAHQYGTGEGPCVDASAEGRWFHAEALEDESRWPRFTPRAQLLGINSILSSPLHAWKRPVGALNIYSRTPSAFASEDQKLASIFASEASIILTDAEVDVTEEERSARFQRALGVRRLIAQAQGVIMEREGVSEEDAYTALRLYSQRSGQSLLSRAREVTASTRRPQPDAGPGRPGDQHA
jgi:hypothetical protein